jgi:HAE1 family hydrophobic/amphiphilic exporter-1
MDLIRYAIANPVKVSVGVLLLVLFGLLSFSLIPVQLTPEIERSVVTVETVWLGHSPQEVEREIIQEQEEQLKSVEGVLKMTSESMDSLGRITLEFKVGTDKEAARVRVSNKLQQVKEYPPDVEEPVINTVNSSDQPIAWFILFPREGNPIDIDTMLTFAEDYIEAEFERVPGVANSNVLGGRKRELHVVLDPVKLAGKDLSIDEVRQRLQGRNEDTSVGDLWESKRRYGIRVLGRFKSPEEVKKLVLKREANATVYLEDVADRVEIGYRKPDGFVRQKGKPGLAVNCQREIGANVLSVMAGLKQKAEQLNNGILRLRGLELEQVYDETVYINSSINLVRGNIFLGSVLTVVVLLLFLNRNSATVAGSLLSVFLVVGSTFLAGWVSIAVYAIGFLLLVAILVAMGRPTLVIALSIPISVIGTFLAVVALGRTLNVISLAGLAFAIGMVVDNAIVVLENIYRRQQLGESRLTACYKGAKEVWGAVLASTLTTLAVFIPILFVQEESGQLFRDLAVAISCAVGLSLLVSITVIPTAAARILRETEAAAATNGQLYSGDGHVRRPPLWQHLDVLSRPIDWFGAAVTGGMVRLARYVQYGVIRRLAVVVFFVSLSVGIGWGLLPKTEYLPVGNSNLILAIMLPPSGYNLEEMDLIGRELEAKLQPYFDAQPGSPEAAELEAPPIQSFFFVVRGRQLFMGARVHEPDALRVAELVPLLRQVAAPIPGMITIVSQRSLFERGLSAGRTVEVHITGPELEQLVAMGGEVLGKSMQLFPGGQALPRPSLDLSTPEVHVRPRWEKAEDMGFTAASLGFTLRSLGSDGAYVGDYYDTEGKKLDIMLLGHNQSVRATQDLERLSLVAPRPDPVHGLRKVVKVSDVAEVALSSGPEQINHYERQRSIMIEVKPPEQVAIEDAIDTIKADIIAPLEARGALEGGVYAIRLSGTADKLNEALGAMKWSFILALLITYLLMAALFESYLYPFVIMISVPLAAVGGLVGLRLLNFFVLAPLDILTMLGFIILIGTVVNNAILIVEQSLIHMREEGMAYREAIVASVRNRIRPIFMTTLTTVLGMLPLVLFPGAGSELYRGLGSVILSGLLISTLFTLFLVPALFSLTLEARTWVVERFRGRRAEAAPAETLSPARRAQEVPVS